MLSDPEEIRIISQARQENIRNPDRPRVPFERIFHDFLDRATFSDSTVIDLGPGQYDFGVLAAARGAQVHAIDNDPAVVELGRHKGFTVVEGNIRTLRAANFPQPFDGLFCKGSCNAFWFDKEDALRHHIAEFGKLIRPGGWAWIAPWNGKSEALPTERVASLLQVQADAFKKLGFWGVDLTDKLTRYYGTHGITANRPVFCLNLPRPAGLKKCPTL